MKVTVVKGPRHEEKLAEAYKIVLGFVFRKMQEEESKSKEVTK